MKLEQELKQLGTLEPTNQFCSDAKQRLMHQISIEAHEQWFVRLVRRIGIVSPRPEFVQMAKMRLNARMNQAKNRFVMGWITFKRLAASTLVMMIAVTSVLFYVDGKVTVNASEGTYIEVESGEVTLKHADHLIWDEVFEQADLLPGDLIRLGDGATATIHFFDDSQMRLSDKAVVLVNQMKVSSGYAQQAVIETFLHEGRAWVQTLNVNDGQAGFTVITRDAILKAQHASFDVATTLTQPTQVRVFNYALQASVLNKDSRTPLATGLIAANQKAILEAALTTRNDLSFDRLVSISSLKEGDLKEAFVIHNTDADKAHLAQLRQRNLTVLNDSTGVLPGQLLYPVKLIKERLALALTFGDESVTNAQIEIANKRLNEAIVLMENGQTEKAKEALAAYQEAAKAITEQAQNNQLVRGQFTNQILANSQKTLVASLPTDAKFGVIKEALDQTEELLESDIIERESVRSTNTIENLFILQDLIKSGDVAGAKALLVQKPIEPATAVNQVGAFTTEEEKEAFVATALDSRQMASHILDDIQKVLAEANVEDAQLISMIQNTSRANMDDLKTLTALVEPVTVSAPAQDPIAIQVAQFVEKVNIYQTWTGQRNQLSRLLNDNPFFAQDTRFLIALRDALGDRSADFLNTKILEVQRNERLEKYKTVQMKIDRARRLHEQRVIELGREPQF